MAMTELGSYYVSLVPTAHNITGHISRQFAPAQGIASNAGAEAGGRFSGAFGHAVSGVGHALGAALKVGVAAAGTAVVAAGAVGIKTAAQLETANISFTTMLGSAEKARGFLGELKTFAAKTPFDLPGLQTAASSLISIGIDSKKIIPIMTTLGNVTSGMGTGAEGVKRATVALQQMNAAGRITAEDLNQLRDAGIPVFDLLTSATGKTKEEIAFMAQNGKLGRQELEQLMAALETGKGFERFNGLMDQQSKSLTGLWSTLKDTFSVGMAEAIEPALPILKGAMSGMIGYLQTTAMPGLNNALKTGMAGGEAFIAVIKDPYLKTDQNGFVGFMQDTARIIANSGIVDLWRFAGETFAGMMFNIRRAGGAADSLRSNGIITNAFLQFGTVLGNGINVIQLFYATLANPLAKASAFEKAGIGGASLAAVRFAETLRSTSYGVTAFFQTINNPAADQTSEGIVGWFERAGMKVRDFLSALDFSSFSGFWASVSEALGPVGADLDSIRGSVVTLAPAFSDFMISVGKLGPDATRVGIDLLAGALGFLADHVDTIIKYMPLIVAGFVAWRVAQMGVNIITAASVPLMVAANVARTAAAVAEYRLVTAQYQAVAAGAAVNTQQNLGLIATVRSTVATVAHNTAVLASATGARIAAAAAWLWNAALSANPIAMVVKGLILLVAGIIWFATQTDAGRAVVAAAWTGIQWIFQGLVNFWNGVMVPAAQWVFGVIGTAATWLYQTIIAPAFAGIQAAAGAVFNWFASWAVPFFQGAMGVLGAVGTWLWQNILAPAFAGIAVAVGVAWAIIRGIFDAWVWVYQNVLAPVISWLWQTILQPAFFLMGEAIQLWWGITSFIFRAFWAILTNVVGPVIGWLWNNIVVPAFQGIAAIIGWWWGNIVAPIFGFFVDVVRAVVGVAIFWLWNQVVRPAFEGIAAIISWAWNTIIAPIWNAIVAFLRDTLGPPFNVLATLVGGAWDRIARGISSTWDWIKNNVLNPLIGFVTTDVPNAFGTAAQWIGDKWNTLKDFAKAPIVWVIDEVINKGVIGSFNKVADFLKIDGIKPVDKPPGWAEGGHTGSGSKYEPKGIVHADEYVVQKKSQRKFSRKYGMETFDYINKYGDLPANVLAAGPGTPVFGGLGSFGSPLQRQIARERKLNVTPARLPGYNIASAANAWSGLAGVEVGANIGGPTVHVQAAPFLNPSWAAGLYHLSGSGSLIQVKSGIGGQAQNVITHEIGHALGLPHAHEGNNAHSIMNYNSGFTMTKPTKADVNALQAIYPGAAKGVNGGGGGDEGGGGFNPFDAIMSGLGDLVKKAFPKGGKFVDLAVGTVTKIISDMGNWLLDKLGGFWDMFNGGGDDDGGGKADVNGVAQKALERTNSFSAENLAALTARIMQESGGDPKAINDWDSNARAGTPSKGLMQLLDSNFQRYREVTLPNDIFHPLANVVAGIKYTKGRYPSRSMESVWRQAGGYANGGLVEFDRGGMLEMGMPAIHRKKKPDAVLTPREWDAMYDIADGVADNGTPVQMHVHPQPGQDEVTIATIATRQLGRRLRR